ncbi:MAG: chloride channel protein, partial [Lachnospiraceae bacterium]|nr:chloride channel protein [Lachnospiraceae bacterium]
MSTKKQKLFHKIDHNLTRAYTTAKWIVFSILTGILMGTVGSLFYHSIGLMTTLRSKYPYFLALLPIGAILTYLLYLLAHDENDGGTNLILSAIQSHDHIPGRMSVLVFLSTLISHLVGASVGREGAALQIGGSLGGYLGKCLKLDETEKKTMIMCGMSAAFSALFGTPMAASIFSMEVVSVGIMHYAALVPCVLASYIASEISHASGGESLHFSIQNIPALDPAGIFYTFILAIAFGLVSMLFCICLHGFEEFFRHILPSPIKRAFVCGSLVLVCTLISGSQTYNGSGVDSLDAFLAG